MGEKRGPELAGVLGLFLALTWVFVSLRVYVRIFLSRGWGSDDLLLVVAQVLFTTYASCSLSGVKYGTGRHISDIPTQDIPKALRYWWLCEIFYTVTTVFLRFSIAVFLLRLCSKTSHKVTIFATMGMVLGFSTFYTFLAIFQCSPISFFWGQYAGMSGHCIDPIIFPDASIAHSAVSFTADWVLGLLPLAMVWGLQMHSRTKSAIAFILSLGILAGIAAIIRVPYIKVLALTDDFLFATTDVAIWSTVETGLGITAAAGSALRPLFLSSYSLSARRSQPKSTAASRGGQQSRRSDIPFRGSRLIDNNTSASSRPDNIELQPEVDTGRSLVKGQGGIIGWMEDKGRIRVERTIEVTRYSESDDTLSVASVEGSSTPWTGPTARPKDERDMV